MVRFSVPCELPFSRRDFWRIRASPSFLTFITRDGLLQSVHASPSEPAPEPAPPGTLTRRLAYVPARVDCPAVVRSVVGDTLFGVEDEQTWNDDLPEEHPDRFVQKFFIRPTFLKGISRTWGELRLEEIGEGDEEGDEGVSGGAVGAEPGEEAEAGDAELARECSSDGSAVSSETEDADVDAAADDADAAGDASGESPGDASNVSECGDSVGERDAVERWARLPAAQRCSHVVIGEARVSIMTVGWFVERSIAHNLRLFYADYPRTVARFRSWLVDKFVDGDDEVPMEQVLDKFLRWEAEREEKEEVELEEEGRDGEGGDESIVDPVGPGKEESAGMIDAGEEVEERSGQRSGSRGRTHGMQIETLTPQPSVELRLSELS